MPIQTSLPNLPFTNHARAALRPNATHSSVVASPQAYPKTDLQTLNHWTSFPSDIHAAIETATTRANLSSTLFTIEALNMDKFVHCEEDIRAFATFALHDPVTQVLEMLGVNGWFDFPGGYSAILGVPDCPWVPDISRPHSKVIVEYKTWWAAHLLNVDAAFGGTHRDTLSQQSSDALHQIYGYMTFNNNKFGILTNWQRALFLRRVETPDGKTLQYYLVELDGSDQSISMLKAWVGIVLLAEDDWFYAPSTASSAPLGRNFGPTSTAWKGRKIMVDAAAEYHRMPINGQYECVSLDFHLCRFDLDSARPGVNGCVVNGRLLSSAVGKPDLQVVFKVVDILRCPDAAEWHDSEAQAYAALENLQGRVIPTLYGFYDIWGILKVLALEPVGEAIPEEEEMSESLRARMKAALQHVHDAGFIHGDVARRNFCRTAIGDIFLVDLERCQAWGNASELANEMNKIDQL